MIDKKLLMHAIVDAIENDLISYIIQICDNINNIDNQLLTKAAERTESKEIEDILRQLDLSDFVKIINENIDKTNFTLKEKKFLNKELTDIIPIRNRVMHPRPLEFNDFVILKNLFENLNKKIKTISWNNCVSLKNIISTNSDKILNIKLSKFKKNSSILENLPIPEFDDTTYIGRQKEIAELKKLIFNDQVKILSIIGEGGVGKTATTVKILYDLIDDPSFKYESIIWSTLKTQQLDKVGFSQIENAISDVNSLKANIANFLPSDTTRSSEQNIIEFAKNFKTILVLDNLETINTKDIKDFIFEFSKYGKIIITSRIGLGELEYRYELNGLAEAESLKYMQALLDYYGLNKILTNNEIKMIASEQLYSNPLTIKWFVRCIKNGMKIDEILSHKLDIVHFCMNNVYEKLTGMSTKILSLLLIENRSISHAEISYFLDIDIDREIEIRKAINEISKSNFIDCNYDLNDNISLTKMSYDYLKLNHYPKQEFVNNIILKRKTLSQIRQMMELKNEFDIFNPKAITSMNSQERIISAKYLLDALSFSAKGNWQNAFSLVELAKKICPNYFECYKISAFLYAIKKDTYALEEYKTALELCDTNIEKCTVLVLLGNYCLEQDERNEAVNYFNLASELYEHPYINLCCTKGLTYQGKYDLALLEIEKINYEKLKTTKYKNMYLTRQADIYLRKAQIDGKKNPENSFLLIKKAINILESSPYGDYKLYNMYSNALFSLSLFYYNEEIMSYVIDKIKNKYMHIRTVRKFKTLCNLLKNKFELIKNKNKTKLLIYIFDYKELIEKLNDQNLGIIIYMKNGYGFIANKKYKDNIYFNYDCSDTFTVGNIVTFDIVKKDTIIAINLSKKMDISDLEIPV
ncbi:MAG: NB-ARC domain-containing protein [Candidatus Aphodocola sp.]